VEQRGPLVGGRGPKVFAKRHLSRVSPFCGEVSPHARNGLTSLTWAQRAGMSPEALV
jgi:hypothetical protein